ncbi:casein kinase I [Lobulomyces angularis]|nr:casein kinase I [Lobulomyces angularis]
MLKSQNSPTTNYVGSPSPKQQLQHSSPQKPLFIYPLLVGNNQFKVGKKIGEGSFGVIYNGVNLKNNLNCAIKFESKKSDAPQLSNEFRCYKLLADTPGIPSVHYFGQEPLFNVLCIDLLGQNLESLFDLCGRQFSIKTVAMLGIRMINLIKSVHEKNLIYRDIKPENFLIGRTPRTNELHYTADFLSFHNTEFPHPTSQIYLVDLGMAKQYRDPKSKIHIPYREKKNLTGTARYMSINTHQGIEQARRDDIESLGNVFMYFLRGNLPWQGLKAPTNKQKYQKIGEKKQCTSVRELSEGFPEEFDKYLIYARNMKFEDEPDYDYMISLFKSVLYNIGEEDDGIFDWMLEMERQLKAREKRKRQEAYKANSILTNEKDNSNLSDHHYLKTNQLQRQISLSKPERSQTPQKHRERNPSFQSLNTSLNVLNYGTDLGKNYSKPNLDKNDAIVETTKKGHSTIIPQYDSIPLVDRNHNLKISSEKKKKKKIGLFSCLTGRSPN